MIHWFSQSSFAFSLMSCVCVCRLCYQQGAGTPRDLAAAKYWFFRAAIAGLAVADQKLDIAYIANVPLTISPSMVAQFLADDA